MKIEIPKDAQEPRGAGSVIVYGAGLAGLLTGNMLRSFKPTVHEAQKELPNNHSALLRFRTEKVGTACAIPFKKVRVQKAIKYGDKITSKPNIFLSNMYSQKVIGSILSRSINDLEPVERYIAPHDLIAQMASNCSIKYSTKLTIGDVEETRNWNPCQSIISTIPMPALMKIMKWKDVPEWPHKEIWTQKARIDSPKCNVYQTIYYPDPLIPFYRISVIGDVVISEFIRKPDTAIGPHIMSALMDDFGIKPTLIVDMKESNQKYGKIEVINEELRKEFIFEMTSKHGIYSVGRFATWRQLLLDDVVEDIQHVERFIRARSNYVRLMHSQKGD
tara:strand:- start:1452 stop:2447 length:996 start_codon:yes stop_codon:yes gene_type:complete